MRSVLDRESEEGRITGWEYCGCLCLILLIFVENGDLLFKLLNIVVKFLNRFHSCLLFGRVLESKDSVGREV